MSIVGNEWSTIFALDSVREFPAKNKSYSLAATKTYRLDSKTLAIFFSFGLDFFLGKNRLRKFVIEL